MNDSPPLLPLPHDNRLTTDPALPYHTEPRLPFAPPCPPTISQGSAARLFLHFASSAEVAEPPSHVTSGNHSSSASSKKKVLDQRARRDKELQEKKPIIVAGASTSTDKLPHALSNIALIVLSLLVIIVVELLKRATTSRKHKTASSTNHHHPHKPFFKSTYSFATTVAERSSIAIAPLMRLSSKAVQDELVSSSFSEIALNKASSASS